MDVRLASEPRVTPQRTRQGVILDGDDTLWATQPLYTDAKRRFADVMSRIGVDPRRARRTLELIDVRNSRRFGLSRKRFPVSMRQAAESLTGDTKHKARLGKTAERIGQSVFMRPAKLYEGVKNGLVELKRRGFFLILMTKGDRRVQLARIRDSGLTKLFDSVEIVPEKTPSAYRRLLRKYNLEPGGTWAVGNSLRSDVLPAMKIGLRTVWIPRDTWKYEFIEFKHASPLKDGRSKARDLRRAVSIIVGESRENRENQSHRPRRDRR